MIKSRALIIKILKRQIEHCHSDIPIDHQECDHIYVGQGILDILKPNEYTNKIPEMDVPIQGFGNLVNTGLISLHDYYDECIFKITIEL